jgi:hypothetical protein
MRIILRNDFHGTTVELNVPRLPYTLSAGQ